MSNQWLFIIILSISTYLSRLVGLEIMTGVTLTPLLKLYFKYVPISVITALILTQVAIPEGGQLTISMPVLLASAIGALTMFFSRSFLLSLVIGIAVGLLTRFFLQI